MSLINNQIVPIIYQLSDVICVLIFITYFSLCEWHAIFVDEESVWLFGRSHLMSYIKLMGKLVLICLLFFGQHVFWTTAFTAGD